MTNKVSSIINNTTIRLRDDGRYEGRVTQNGFCKSFYGSTVAEVKNKIQEYLLQPDMGLIPTNGIKVKDVIEMYLRQRKLLVEPSTYRRYSSVANHQILPIIGAKPITSITTADIQALIDAYALGRKPATRALSHSGLNKILEVLRPSMELAIFKKYILTNPCDGVVVPKERYLKVSAKQQFALSDQQMADFKNTALAKHAVGGEYRSRNGLVLVLILSTGMRISEALAIEWSDYDDAKKILKVNKTVQYGVKGSDGKATIKSGVKTEAGVRNIPVNDSVAWILSELQDYDERKGITSRYICCSNTGNLNDTRNIQRSIDRIVARTPSIDRHMSCHTLRHSFGSKLIREGIPVEVVASLMGHSSAAVTYKHYVHVLDDQTVDAMEKVHF